jgi:hypothetical protein
MSLFNIQSLHYIIHIPIHKSFLISDFVNVIAEGENDNKLAGNLRAVAQGDERDVEGKEQSCWCIGDAGILPRISGIMFWARITWKKRIIFVNV